ncbi:DUF5996 family protein [Fulvivirgaceae bacterium BMA12]|uniref:DUF5996 family protein n=1 Tax=Agaribacillus aureus TaxID=3051825 RepID=A0ABT8LI11_9BACT|nr:DUF5996 family protein [Fulvivirgaceae bacterium BMA12]
MSAESLRDWKMHEKTNLKTKKLLAARIELHRAVQLVGAVGRSYSPPSGEDEYGSLEWNNVSKLLVSVPVGQEEKIYAGLSLAKFNLGLYSQNGRLIEGMDLKKCTLSGAVNWLKVSLGKAGLQGEKLTMELPYEIPEYAGDTEKKFKYKPKNTFKEFSNLYENAALILSHYRENNDHASEIKCWPHHFDIAMQLIFEGEGNPDEKKYVGLGFSPGDENYKRPYYYINLWPAPDIPLSDLPSIQGGKWNIEGWFGATLDIKNFKKINDAQAQMELVKTFYDAVLSEIFKIIGREA